jgi:hypothetical protein
VDGRGTINQLASLIIVIERLPHEVDVVSKGLTKALLEHEVVQHGERDRAKDMQSSLAHRISHAPVV